MRQIRAATLLGVLLAFNQSTWSQYFELIDIGSLDTPFEHTIAWDVNDGGVACGEARISFFGGTPRPFVYSDGSIGALALPPNWCEATAVAVNDDGIIIGYGRHPSGVEHALRWEAGVASDLYEFTNGSMSRALDVNQQGDVVGWKRHGAIFIAVLLQGRTLVEFGVLPFGSGSAAAALNDLAHATGRANTETTNGLAFYWDGNRMSSLGTLPGHDTSFGQAINNADEIVGSSVGPSQHQAFHWNTSRLIALPPLAGYSNCEAHDINNSSWIVGFSGTYPLGIPFGPERATLWIGGEPIDLNQRVLCGPPMQLRGAFGISDAGYIVGYATTPQDLQRAFLLRPIAHPADVNGDQLVNAADLASVIAAWGLCVAPCPADINCDGAIDVDDLLLVINHWT